MVRYILPKIILIAGALAFAAPAQAHSRGQCADSVVDACNAAFPNNYDGRIACVNNGLNTCDHHSHGGGGGKKSASDSYTSGGTPAASGGSAKRLR